MTAACARCASALEEGDLRCAVCALPVPAPPPVHLVRPRAQILRCTGCGAALAYDAHRQAPACAFCGAVVVLEEPADPVEAARLRVPFAVDHAQAAAALRRHLADAGYFAPRALHEEAVLEAMTPLCWAAWLVDATATVAWTADSDAGAQRAAWAPHSGTTSLAFDRLVVPASRGLTAAECGALARGYDLSRAVAADAPPAPGEVEAVIEGFDVQRSAARVQVTAAIEAIARTRVEPHIPGRRFRKVAVACQLEGLATERVALPAWVLAYRFRDQTYRAIVHGQRADLVVGRMPIDWRKVGKLVALAAALVLAILAVVWRS